MSGFVLDASITLAWYFADEVSPSADEVFALTDTHVLVVPPHWYAEVANGVLMAERRKRRSLADSSRVFAKLAELKLETDSASPDHAFGAVTLLARSHDLTIHDALYLELAERRGLPLATLDRPLARAARKVGVIVLGDSE